MVLYRNLFLALLACSGIVSFLITTTGPSGPKDTDRGRESLTKPPPLKPFRPAPQAAGLRQFLSSTPDLGLCHNNQPLQQSAMPPHACIAINCILSERGPYSLDSLQPMSSLGGGGNKRACVPARGGHKRAAVKLAAHQTQQQESQQGVVRQRMRGVASVLSSSSRSQSQGSEEGKADIQVSVVMPVFNNDGLASQSLLEVFRTSAEVASIELVVVDDCSKDRLWELERLMQQLRDNFGTRSLMLRNPTNQGFGASVNYGMREASGRFAVILNTDAFVVHGWLAALLHTFAMKPDAGLVGPLFLGQQNLVTEAGGIVFRDASAANYGRFYGPHENFTYLRRVDYVSAACVMIRRELFLNMSGLDLSYGKGYYEDTDLAMAVRAHGFQVYMQPFAVVYHQEGSTLGTDESGEKRALMATNRQKFATKWRTQLEEGHLPPSVDTHTAATQRYAHAILWVDDMIPEPDGDSGSVRMYHLWDVLLSASFHITFHPNMFRYMHYALMARMHGVNIIVSRPSLLARGCPYNAIGISRKSVFAQWFPILRRLCPRVPIIFDTVDLAFIREGRLALSQNFTMQSSTDALIETLQGDTKLSQLLEEELQLVRQSSASLVVSESEKAILSRFITDTPVHVVSNIYEPQGKDFRCEGRQGILFVGNLAHEPNRQAITYFVDSILPLVMDSLTAEELLSFSFHVVGGNLFDKDFPALHHKYVTYDGHASDEQLAALYRHVRLVVAPLLAGAGVKGKISQAMSFGVPVVATSVAVEGMHLENGTNCLIADTPAQFSARVVEAYRSCELWQHLSEQGLQNLKDFFSIQRAKESLLLALSSLGVT